MLKGQLNGEVQLEHPFLTPLAPVEGRPGCRRLYYEANASTEKPAEKSVLPGVLPTLQCSEGPHGESVVTMVGARKPSLLILIRALIATLCLKPCHTLSSTLTS